MSEVAVPPPLPRYRHTIEIEAGGGKFSDEMLWAQTALMQWMRAGTLKAWIKGPDCEPAGDGDIVRLVVQVETTCPPHDLGETGWVTMRVTDAELVA